MNLEETPEFKALRAFQKADAKYRMGDGLSDEELALLIPRYKAASEAVDAICHSDYRLVANDLSRRYRELQGFREARRRA